MSTKGWLTRWKGKRKQRGGLLILFSGCFGSCIGFLGPGGATQHHDGRGFTWPATRPWAQQRPRRSTGHRAPRPSRVNSSGPGGWCCPPPPLCISHIRANTQEATFTGWEGGAEGNSDELTEVVCFGGCNIKRGTDLKMGFALLPVLRWWHSAKIRIYDLRISF